MTIAFNQIPGNIRVPFVRFEVNAGASPFQSIQRLLLIGQKTTAGTAAVEVPLIVSQNEDGLFGAGSMLASMYKIARAQAPFQEIWAVPLADVAGGTAASGSVVFATPTLASSIVLYFGGYRVTFPVSELLTSAEVATAAVAAINACPGIVVQAVVDATTASKVNVTALNKGTLGNTIRIETKLFMDDGDTADQLCTIVQLSGGAGDPLLDNTIAVLGDDQWDWIVMPYCQDALLLQMETWLDSRWGPMSQRYGHQITALAGTAGTVQAFTSARNSWHTSIMPINNAPQPTWLWAAAVGGVVAQHLQTPPELSLPLQTIELIGILPPKAVSDQWSTVQRQSFYFAGASGYRVQDGSVQIDRLITTYQRNVWGSPDQTWLDINTIAQLMYGLPFLMQYMTSTYPRSALVDSNPNNIQGFVTADDIRNAFIHAYKNLEAIGVFENSAVFATLLICERNAQDPNRVDTYLPLDHVNQLRVLAVNATSFLEFPTA
jgi:phage tail sheath gpL-like